MKARSDRTRSAVRKAIVVALLFAAFLAGYMLKSSLQADHVHGAPADANKPAIPQKWYCSMHPQIIRDGPGKCPICGMALVPMPSDLTANAAPRQLAVSEESARLMDIVTSRVERKFVTAEIRMVGKIDYDETRVKDITAWVPGRIDRLYVEAGIPDHVLLLLSVGLALEDLFGFEFDPL